MIKRFLIIFMVVLMVATPLTAYADIVMGNEFFYKIKDKTQKLDRNRFIADGPNGTVSAKEKPGSDKEATVYRNGTRVFLDCTYIYKGKYWGISYPAHSGMAPGWVPMDQLLVAYVRIDFADEHIDEFYTYTGSYDAALTAEKLVLWEWPGSDSEKRILDYYTYIMNYDFHNPEANRDFVIKDISADYAYKDKQGREWGYVNIIYTYTSWNDGRTANLQEWICLSDPENSDISAFNPAPEPTKWQPPEKSLVGPLLIVLAVALIAVTAVLIKVYWKPGKSGREQ
jgi:hypothetical protein